MDRPFSRIVRGILPLLPIAPAIVVAVGITTAVVIAVLGISQLQQTSDDAAMLRAAALTGTLAARLRSTALEDRSELLSRAARRSATEILLVQQQDGQIAVRLHPPCSTVQRPARNDVAASTNGARNSPKIGPWPPFGTTHR